MKPVSESAIQAAILSYLEIKNVFAWRNQTGASRAVYKGKERFFRFGEVGSPDIIAIIPIKPPQGSKFYDFLVNGQKVPALGIFVGIEVKSSKGKLSPAQESFRERVISQGGLYITARSVADVARLLGDKI